MAQTTVAVLEPRKSPVQARSTASVDAMLEATIQVLLQVGKERLTTTRVAARAGVSVGTLYQYFPNKSSLLQAVLKRHLCEVGDAVEETCRAQRGRPLREMASAVITAFLAAKVRDAKTSVALYSVASDVDGTKIVQETSVRSNRAIVEMLKSSEEGLTPDPDLVAWMMQGAMFGVSRRLLETGAPEKHIEMLRRELIFFVCAYLDACTVREGVGR